MFEKYKATKTDEPAGWIEQEELCWQALYFSGSSYNRDGYERSSYYETEQEAIEAAKEAERIGNRLNQLTGQTIRNFVHSDFLNVNTRLDIQLLETDEYKYTLLFFCDDGFYYGRANDGQAYESQAICYAAAYLHFITND